MVVEQILNNKPVWVAALAWAIAQILKIILTSLQYGRIDLTRAYGAGGMPSSHSALVTALAVSLGKLYGFDSGVFAVSIVTGLIVMYDAAGVRRAAGMQAEAINFLFHMNGMKREEQLKVLLGHTPFQVFAGAGLGIALGCLV